MLKKLSLRTLLVLLSVGGVIFTSLLLLTGLLYFQKANIQDSLIDGNIAYARKLADVTDRYIVTAQRELAYSAKQIKNFRDTDQLRREADRLREQSGFFNSVVIVSADAVIKAISPGSLQLQGVKVTSEASQQALSARKAFVSKPFTSIAGNYIISLSQPVFSEDGDYLGYVSGTVYLRKNSMLSEILSEHFYKDKSEISIVSNDGEVIYNHDPAVIGSHIHISNNLSKILSTTQSGKFNFSDNGKKYMLGFASLTNTEWNVFVYGTSDAVAHIFLHTAENAFWFVLIIILLMSLTVTFISSKISAPLERLAEITSTVEGDDALTAIPKINGWYSEAEKLKKAFYHYVLTMSGRVRILSDEAMTDPLTGLSNRRGFTTLAGQYLFTEGHSLIALDIDYFKRINDTYGHDAGDRVLRDIGRMIKEFCRSTDIVSRFGGEEFIIFLPFTDLEESRRTAERIRNGVQQTQFPGVGSVTLSAGVTSKDRHICTLEQLINRADAALYDAKRSGRNIVVLSRDVNDSPR